MATNYMYKSLQALANDECNNLVKSKDLSLEKLYLKTLALIIVGRMRMFLRGKSELELYAFSKEFSSLKKMRANERHVLAHLILENI